MKTKPPTSASQVASKGGIARATLLSADQRTAIARRAVEKRWENAGKRERIPLITHGSPESPLRIADLEIPCYVLDNGMRVLSLGGILKALGLSLGSAGASTRQGTKPKDGSNRLSRFAGGKRLSAFVSEELGLRMTSPVRFRTSTGSIPEAQGYEATILPDICDAVLAARAAGALLPQQEPVAARCEILVRAFARVGIIALVDEATGFQYDRPRQQLQDYLKRFLAEGLVRWARSFPNDYFKHLCRLRSIELRPDMKLPQYFGHITNDIVYRRIAPGLLKALKDRHSERGTPSNKLHWWTSEELGHPSLLLHLGTVVGLMKINTDYEVFRRQLDTVAPTYPEEPGLYDNAADWANPI